jgi:ABC-type sulfate transport system permease component
MRKINCNLCIILSCLVGAVLFVPFIHYLWTLSKPNEEFMSAMIGVLIAVIALALPIVLSNISNSLKSYKNKVIANLFKEECTYRQMFSLLPIFISVH